MTRSSELFEMISEGRTDLVFDLVEQQDWDPSHRQVPVYLHSWLNYYNDVTALKFIMQSGCVLSQKELDDELLNAAFFGHWKVCDYLLELGANVRVVMEDNDETPLHSALCKAGRPHFIHTVKLLLEHGADPNAKTIPNKSTAAFMRDVRTKGETPLHRAAAFADEAIIECLISHGADIQAQDAAGDTPLSWASWHLRPASILKLLAFPPHKISDKQVTQLTSDHGAGWGNGMERKQSGKYLPLSLTNRPPTSASTGDTP